MPTLYSMSNETSLTSTFGMSTGTSTCIGAVEQIWSPLFNSTVDASIVWVAWNVDQPAQRPPVDAEQEQIQQAAERERQRADNDRHHREYEEGIRQRAVASERAKELLLMLLDEHQKQEYLQHERFHLVMPDGRRYLINKGIHGNVKLIGDCGRQLESLCGHPHGVPVEDSMASQLLMLRTDEAEFRRRSNITRHAV